VREVFIFRPPRRNGLIFHSYTILVLTLIGVYSLWKASLAQSGPSFLVYLLAALVAVAFIPGLLYRMYALQRASYVLARDGISLYWGLRREEIPIDHVTWVGTVEQYKQVLDKPPLRIPGAILGSRMQGDGTIVEYLAANTMSLVMIITPQRTFAISPANHTEFLHTYRKLAEFGSLAPIESKSDFPTFLLTRSWADRPARILLLVSGLLAVGLIAWVSLSIPSHPQVALRLNADNSPAVFVPGVRLLLLPVLNTFFFITDLLMGLFFYRREDTRSLSYLMWASSALTSLLFTGAVYFILRAA
jgi:hypothetical protein